MFRHDDISDDHKAVTLARLFQYREEAIAAVRGVKKRQSPVTGTGDKVQRMSAVSAMQTAGHDKAYGIGSIVPALAKNARAGHPQFRNGKIKAMEGWATRQSSGPAIPLNSLTVWHNYNNAVYAAAHANASGTILEASMYGGETLPNGDGTILLSWADDVASTAIANHLGIGAESLAFSDLPLYASNSPCSNDWCQLFNEYSLSGPMLGLQTVSLSDPTCVTNPACGNATGSLTTVLPFGTQRHARVFEIGYEDLLCAYDSSSSGSSCAPGTGSAYPLALQNSTSGVPSSTATLSGAAKLSSNATLN